MYFKLSKVFLLVVFIATVVFAAYFAYLKGVFIEKSGLIFIPSQPSNIHLYQDSSRELGKVNIKIFYVLPKDKEQNIVENWEKLITSAADGAVEFHSLQYRGRSKLSYDIYPKPIILREKGFFYDTEKTSGGNPYGLISISKEIDQRVFNKEGDLYNDDFISLHKGEYRVIGLVYEGVGASGSAIYESELKTAKEIALQLGIPESEVVVVDIKSVDGFFILSRDFLGSEERKKSYGASLFYHEFGHTLGMRDQYEKQTGRPFSNGIMGIGRYKPIEVTFIEPEFLKGMGF